MTARKVVVAMAALILLLALLPTAIMLTRDAPAPVDLSGIEHRLAAIDCAPPAPVDLSSLERRLDAIEEEMAHIIRHHHQRTEG